MKTKRERHRHIERQGDRERGESMRLTDRLTDKERHSQVDKNKQYTLTYGTVGQSLWVDGHGVFLLWGSSRSRGNSHGGHGVDRRRPRARNWTRTRAHGVGHLALHAHASYVIDIEIFILVRRYWLHLMRGVSIRTLP